MTDKTEKVVVGALTALTAIVVIALSWIICSGALMFAGWLLGMDVSLKTASGCYVALMTVRFIFRKGGNKNA